MLLSLIFATLCQAKNDIEYFLDREIRIFSAPANHIFLVNDMVNNTLLHVSKFGDLENMFSAFQISKDSTKFRIKSGEKYIKAGSGEIVLSDSPFLWKIKKVTLGYTISDGSSCLTIQANSSVGLSRCTDVDDQIFDFRIADEDSRCDQNKAKKASELVIKVINETGRHGVDTALVQLEDGHVLDTHHPHDNHPDKFALAEVTQNPEIVAVDTENVTKELQESNIVYRHEEASSTSHEHHSKTKSKSEESSRHASSPRHRKFI